MLQNVACKRLVIQGYERLEVPITIKGTACTTLTAFESMQQGKSSCSKGSGEMLEGHIKDWTVPGACSNDFSRCSTRDKRKQHGILNEGNDVFSSGNGIFILGDDISSLGNDIFIPGSDISSLGNGIFNLGNGAFILGNDIPSLGNGVFNSGSDISSLGNDIFILGSAISSLGNNTFILGSAISSSNR